MSHKHISEVPEFIKDDKGKNIPRRAVAPYNFVELPEKVVPAQPLPSGDRYHLDKHTGKIECTLTTESPLYIRSGLTKEEFQAGKEAKDLPDFFYTDPATKSEKPVLPGSSIRGMLRTLVEIISFSKIDRVTDNKLFYRSLGDRALQGIYSSNFVENLRQVQVPPHPQAHCYRAKVHTGFLRKHKNSYIIEECGYGRIDRVSTNRVIPKLPNQSNFPTKPLYQGSRLGKTPSWTYQHQTIYIEMDKHEQNYFFPRQVNNNGKERHPDLYLRFRQVHSASFTPAPGLQKATLVITGDMQHKHLEFVFLDEKLEEYPVSEEMVRRFQDDDQITKWQEKAYPKDKPSRGYRQQDGYLQDGEPVFFLLNDDGKDDKKTVRFFGRTQMFRLPYENSPLDFVPPKLRYASLTDIAEAIFGYVNGKEPREKARAGRVFISDATLNPNQEEKVKSSLNKNPVPILLSSPKPTTFQHYLVQKVTDKSQLKHYASKPPTDKEAGETVIRGHKLYWHKPARIEVPRDASDTQTTKIKPINQGIEFTFTIHFENLSKVELGALLWVLSLGSEKSQTLGTGKSGEKYCFSLGMGKPLGMGAVRIDYNLHLSDRSERYSRLFNDNHDQWKTGEEDQPQTSREEVESVKAFEKYVLDRICCQDYPKDKSREQLQHLKDLPRIETLLAMLQCNEIPDVEETRYMRIEPKPNEYAERPVLPTPLDIRGISDNRRLPNVHSSSGGTKENKSIDNPKKKVISSKPKPKSKPKNKSNPDRTKGGDSPNRATLRPPKPKK